jgi:MOSC domain-containing protein YiiM
MGTVISVNLNDQKEFRKLPRAEARLIDDFGLEGDRHAGRPMRQVSLLDAEVLDDLVSQGIPAEPGILGENLTLRGIDVMGLPELTQIRIGDALLEISAERPACREMNEIHPGTLKQMVGRAGKMARVVTGGLVRPGDRVEVVL